MGTTLPEITPLAKSLIREIVSEPGKDGTGSTSRTATLLIVIATITWVSFAVYKSGTLAMPVVEAALTFMGGGGTVFYGVNRVTAGMQKKE